MTDKFQNKYRIPSARWQNWDYGFNGAYFITICTHNRECYFGDIVVETLHATSLPHKMVLSPVGVLADVFWHEIINHAKHVELGEFVVMPNHIHGIIIINKPDHSIDANSVQTLHATSLPPAQTLPSDSVQTLPPDFAQTLPSDSVQTLPSDSVQTLPSDSVQTLHATSLPEFMANISPKPNSLSTIIRSYKSAITKHAHRLGYEMEWQSRFHDHVIRDDEEYLRIAQYITSNVNNWPTDKFNQPNSL